MYVSMKDMLLHAHHNNYAVTDLMRHATNASIATLKENPQIDYMDLCIAVEDAIKDFIKSYMRVIGSSGRYSFEKHNGPELD